MLNPTMILAYQAIIVLTLTLWGGVVRCDEFSLGASFGIDSPAVSSSTKWEWSPSIAYEKETEFGLFFAQGGEAGLALPMPYWDKAYFTVGPVLLSEEQGSSRIGSSLRIGYLFTESLSASLAWQKDWSNAVGSQWLIDGSYQLNDEWSINGWSRYADKHNQALRDVSGTWRDVGISVEWETPFLSDWVSSVEVGVNHQVDRNFTEPVLTWSVRYLFW